MGCKWCGVELPELKRAPGTAGGPKLTYNLQLCQNCNQLREVCTSPYHHQENHRCGVYQLDAEQEKQKK